jgi:DUF1009 family protein
MSDPAPGNGPLAIICGGGSFPSAVAAAAERRGRQPIMFGLRGWAEPETVERYRHHWIAIGQLGRFIDLARNEDCREAILIGSLLRPPVTQIRLDWLTIRSMPHIVRSYRGGDDRLLSGIANLFEDNGIHVVGVDEVAPELFVPEGLLGHHEPSSRDRADIAYALQMMAALGPFDVGQAAVIAGNHVLAVEAAEGTDQMLQRVADLRSQGRVTAPAGTGVLVKAPKAGQDRRVDLPSIGPKTIENVARAGLAGIAVTAGSTVIADASEVIAAADRAKIFVAGVPDKGVT